MSKLFQKFTSFTEVVTCVWEIFHGWSVCCAVQMYSRGWYSATATTLDGCRWTATTTTFWHRPFTMSSHWTTTYLTSNSTSLMLDRRNSFEWWWTVLVWRQSSGKGFILQKDLQLTGSAGMYSHSCLCPAVSVVAGTIYFVKGRKWCLLLVLWPLYRSTCVSWFLQLRTGELFELFEAKFYCRECCR